MDAPAIPAFSVTPRAAEEIAAIAARQGRAPLLRLAVSAGGCSGLQYGFDLADAPEAGDLVVEEGPATVLVDEVSLDFLGGAVLDWHDSLMGAHFKVVNPQAVSGCGCGTSFAVA